MPWSHNFIPQPPRAVITVVCVAHVAHTGLRLTVQSRLGLLSAMVTGMHLYIWPPLPIIWSGCLFSCHGVVRVLCKVFFNSLSHLLYAGFSSPCVVFLFCWFLFALLCKSLLEWCSSIYVAWIYDMVSKKSLAWPIARSFSVLFSRSLLLDLSTFWS